MRVLILGADGYLGWPTAMYLAEQGHHVHCVDSLIKRWWEMEMGVKPLVEVPPLAARIAQFNKVSGEKLSFDILDISTNERRLREILAEFLPDAIIHYAEQPSAPYSMSTLNRAVETQRNNILGTLNLMFCVQHSCSDVHIIKLGTMGEYGTPNIAIEEGWLDVVHEGRKDRVLYPKRPGSFYHLSKVFDSHNLEFGCRIWGSRVTDLNQGIVYGTSTDQTDKYRMWGLDTGFHYDSIFGTVLNRFIVQAACGVPLTVYGEGGQTRGFLDIRDTIRCVELALENPAAEGEFRVFNQFTQQFMIEEIALMVVDVCGGVIDHIPNPRVEAEEHFYEAKHTALLNIGLEPHLLGHSTIQGMYEYVCSHRDKIDTATLRPGIKWKGGGI